MIKRAETAVELLSGILSDRQDLCGIIVYGHGGPSGYLGDGSWEPGNHINQADLIRCLQGSFQIAWANVRQCYGLKDAFEAMWDSVAVKVAGFRGINAAGIDLNNLFDPKAKLKRVHFGRGRRK